MYKYGNTTEMWMKWSNCILPENKSGEQMCQIVSAFNNEGNKRKIIVKMTRNITFETE